MTDVTVMTMTQCAKECERHARAKEAFVGARDAARARRGAESSTSGRDDGDDEVGKTGKTREDTPNGRLEWVIKRAFDRKHHQTIDDFKRDADATWDFLEATWTREGREDRRDAARIVRASFESKWASRVVGGEFGGGSVVCVPSIGVSRETIGMQKSSSTFSLDSQAVGCNGGRESGNLLRGADVARACDYAQGTMLLERCKYIVENFMNQPEAMCFIAQPTGGDETAAATTTDLSSVLKRIESGELATPRDVWRACAMIWHTHRLSHHAGSKMSQVCDRAELMFTGLWRAEGLDRFHSPSEDEAASPGAGTENSEGSLLASTTMKDAVRPTTTKSGPRVASAKCDVCKRSKKGKCGTETAPKSCLARPENQSAERQAQIRERVSKLKPMPPKTATRKRSDAAKRKLAETAKPAAENDFGRVFDENDPDNFISQLLRQNDSWMTNRPHVSLDSTTLHVADEQLRLESMQGARAAARFGDDFSAPRVGAPNVAIRVDNLRRDIASTAAQLHERTLKFQLSGLATSQSSDDAQRDARLRERAALEDEIHALQQTHQNQVRELHRLCDRSGSSKGLSTTKRTKVIETNAMTTEERPEFGHEHAHVSVATASVFDDASREKSTLHPPSHHVGVTGAGDDDDDDVLFDFPTM